MGGRSAHPHTYTHFIQPATAVATVRYVRAIISTIRPIFIDYARVSRKLPKTISNDSSCTYSRKGNGAIFDRRRQRLVANAIVIAIAFGIDTGGKIFVRYDRIMNFDAFAQFNNILGCIV